MGKTRQTNANQCKKTCNPMQINAKNMQTNAKTMQTNAKNNAKPMQIWPSVMENMVQDIGICMCRLIQAALLRACLVSPVDPSLLVACLFFAGHRAHMDPK